MHDNAEVFGVRRGVAIAMSLCVVLGARAHAQLCDTGYWSLEYGSPLARSELAITYDSWRNRSIMLGGYWYGIQFGEIAGTWEWDGLTWHLVSMTGPRVRIRHGMAFDSVRGRTVMFGGNLADSFQAFDDTWEWDGIEWIRRTPAVFPPARYYTSMAFDSSRGRTVLYGGRGPNNVGSPQYDDTWEWDGTNWQLMVEHSLPGIRPGGVSLAYDSHRHRTLLIGGTNADDLWSWDGQTWTLLSESGPPGNYNNLVYDAARDRAVVFGGETSVPASDGQTWEWDGSTWSLAAHSAPKARESNDMASHAATGEIVMLSTEGVTWLWNGEQWRRSSTVPMPQIPWLLAFDDARSQLVLLAEGETWLFNGLHWSQQNVPCPASGHDMIVYDNARQVVLYFGQDGTWEWNGSIWTRRFPTHSPSARMGHRLAFDSVRGEVILFGGFAGSANLGDMWSWNGTDWQELTVAGPSPRGQFGMATDTRRARVLLHGGLGGLTDTWAWDGFSWTLLAQDGPIGPSGHMMSYDPVNDRIVALSHFFGQSWEFDGLRWQLADSQGVCVGHTFASMAYDYNLGKIVFASRCDGTPSEIDRRWIIAWSIMLAPRITQQPMDQAVDLGDSAVFTVVTDARIPITTQWRKNGVPLFDDGRIHGSQTTALVIDNAMIDDIGSYDVVITSECGVLSSSSAGLIVIASPMIWSGPSDATACVGQSATYSVMATGTPPMSYQWRRGGAPIPGQTASVLNIDSIIAADAGTYDAAVTNAYGTVISEVAFLVVEPVDAIATYTPVVVCGSSTLTTPAQLAFMDIAETSDNGCNGQHTFRAYLGSLCASCAVRRVRQRPTCVIESATTANQQMPQSVLFDSAGSYPLNCGARNRLFVATRAGSTDTIQIFNTSSSIPHTACVTIQSDLLGGIGQMAIDVNGRVLLGSVSGDHVWQLSAGVLTPLYSPGNGLSPRAIVIDSQLGLFVATAADGRLHRVDADGSQIGTYATDALRGATAIASAPPGPFHGSLFVACASPHDKVLEVNPSTGAMSVFIEGVAVHGIGFDPEGYMYLSVPSQNQVLRVVPDLPGDMNGDGAINACDVSGFIAALLRSPSAPLPILTADVNGDGCADGGDIPAFVSFLN